MDTKATTETIPQYDVEKTATRLRDIMDAFGILAEKDRMNQLVREKLREKKLKKK
jgi:hypothetical protein